MIQFIHWDKGGNSMAYTIDNNEGIMTFTIHREEKRNAVNDEVMDGLQEVITYIRNHDNVRFF